MLAAASRGLAAAVVPQEAHEEDGDLRALEHQPDVVAARLAVLGGRQPGAHAESVRAAQHLQTAKEAVHARFNRGPDVIGGQAGDAASLGWLLSASGHAILS